MNRKWMLGILLVIAGIAIIFSAAVFGSKNNKQQPPAVQSSGSESKAVYEADPAQKGELLIADDEITNKARKMGRSWYYFDANAEMTSKSYNFLPDGTYALQCKYSVAAGGKFVYESGTYRVPEKGVLVLYPEGEKGVIYDYRIEGENLYLKVKGSEEWSVPYQKSDN